MLSRDEIREVVVEALQPHEAVRAVWEAGSAAFGRDDEHSDLDLQALVRDDFAEDAFDVVEAALGKAAGLEDSWRVPDPTWHGHHQAFYVLRDASPFHFVDFVVMRTSAERGFDERERHGEPHVLFDRDGVIESVDLDWDRHDAEMRDRLHRLKATQPLLRLLVRKDILRGSTFSAVERYFTDILNPLHTVLMMKHAPERYDYAPNYARLDLPTDVADRLDRLALVASLEDLEDRLEEATAWFDAVAGTI